MTLLDFDTLRDIALSFPGVTEGETVGLPAFYVHNRILARLLRAGDIALKLDQMELDFLVESQPETYHTTEDFRRWWEVRVNFENMTADEFRKLFEKAWRLRAQKRDLVAFKAR